ncbi:BatD family protein [Aureitalea marina]|nr:BatD family protein [Aureitalea marina]
MLLLSGWGIAQTKPASIWATARLSKEQVMVGEPLIVTVTVYTSTWFTKPPVFSEIQVRGAVMTKLESRTGAKTVTIGRKQYPAIEQRFVIYPNAIGQNTLPEIEVVTTGPPEGGYKGIERTVHTKSRSFDVLAPPEGIDATNWLSAYDLNLTETWDRPLRDLKAGDILERRITIKAQGALAAFISPIVPEKPDFGTIYPKQPILGNIQGQTLFNGSRTEILTYLLEEDGSFTIPEVSVQWFNLRNRQLETESIPSFTIDIADNPDLEFILSRQKELQEELDKETERLEEEDEEPFEFMGLNWWQLTLVILAASGILSLIYRWIKKIEFRRKEAQKAKLISEPYLFKELEKAISSNDPENSIQALARWYDAYRQGKYGASIYEFAQDKHQETLLNELVKFGEIAFKEDRLAQSTSQLKSLYTALSDTRTSLNKESHSKNEEAWMNINPTTH